MDTMILFSSKKEKQNQTSMLSIGPCDTLILLYLNHEEYYSRSPVIHSICSINKLVPIWVTWARSFDSPEVKNFNKIMIRPCLAWTHGLHHGMVVVMMIWCVQIAGLYGGEYQNKAYEKK